MLENEITEEEKKISELIQSYNQIHENLENLIEKKSVFDKTCQLFLSEGENIGVSSNRMANNPMPPGDLEEGFRSDLNFIAGVIKAEDDLRMKRMVFRVSRGRAIPTFFDLSIENKISVKIFFAKLSFFYKCYYFFDNVNFINRKKKYRRKYLLYFSKEELMVYYSENC